MRLYLHTAKRCSNPLRGQASIRCWRTADSSRWGRSERQILRRFGRIRFMRPHQVQALSTDSRKNLREFEGYEFRWLRAGVGYGVGYVAGEPFGVAGFHVGGGVSGGKGLAFDGFFEG